MLFVLLAGAILSGAAIVARAAIGPFHLIVSVNSPLAAESIFAVCSIALALLSKRTGAAAAEPRIRWSLLLLAVIAAVVLAFQGAQIVSFLCDDYFVAFDAVRGRGAHFFNSLVSTAQAYYYRPAAYTILWFAAQPLGTDALKWHLFSFGLHLLNCGLVYGVAARVGLPGLAAALAALLFGIHGARPESVIWLAGCFELISAVFVLSALLLYLRSDGDFRRGGYYGALLCFLAGLWSKESAYVLPLLLLVLPGRFRWRPVAPFFLLAGMAFVHRWRALGGIGGYVDPQSGRSEAGSISLLRIAKLVGARLWAALYFPINWEVMPGALLALSAALAMIALIYTSRFRASPKVVRFGLLAAAIAALPAASQLLIGPDLQKSRLLYLPSVGFVIFLAAVIWAVPSNRMRAGVAAAVLFFEAAALRHNLAIWEDVSRIGVATCNSARELVKGGPRSVTVIGMPGSIRGVYFFMNGFRDCLDMGDGGHWSATMLPSGAAVPMDTPGPVLAWRNEREGLARIH